MQNSIDCLEMCSGVHSGDTPENDRRKSEPRVVSRREGGGSGRHSGAAAVFVICYLFGCVRRMYTLRFSPTSFSVSQVTMFLKAEPARP